MTAADDGGDGKPKWQSALTRSDNRALPLLSLTPPASAPAYPAPPLPSAASAALTPAEAHSLPLLSLTRVQIAEQNLMRMRTATLKTKRERERDPFFVKCKSFLDTLTKAEEEGALLSARVLSPPPFSLRRFSLPRSSLPPLSIIGKGH